MFKLIIISLLFNALLNFESIISSWVPIDKVITKREVNSTELGFNTTLENIAIPRVSGSDGNRIVREYIKKRMNDLGWTVSLDSFDAKTPLGVKTMSNIIAVLNKKACKRIVIGCHYDSKYFKEFQFIGAHDSAVSCALMIHLAQVLQVRADKHKLLNSDPTLQFIFFDGEEAFERWSATDSLYGSRHLAEKLQTTKLTLQEKKHINWCFVSTELGRINYMILLDLIGAIQPTFHSHYDNTYYLYEKLIKIEKKYNKGSAMFLSGHAHSEIEDDHIPFLRRGIPVLHLISVPFPETWHKSTDDIDNLDFPTIYMLIEIFRDFVLEIMKIEVKSKPKA